MTGFKLAEWWARVMGIVLLLLVVTVQCQGRA